MVGRKGMELIVEHKNIHDEIPDLWTTMSLLLCRYSVCLCVDVKALNWQELDRWWLCWCFCAGTVQPALCFCVYAFSLHNSVVPIYTGHGQMSGMEPGLMLGTNCNNNLLDCFLTYNILSCFSPPKGTQYNHPNLNPRISVEMPMKLGLCFTFCCLTAYFCPEQRESCCTSPDQTHVGWVNSLEWSGCSHSVDIRLGRSVKHLKTQVAWWRIKSRILHSLMWLAVSGSAATSFRWCQLWL